MQSPERVNSAAAAPPPPSFEQLYGLNLRLALSTASSPVIFNDIFVATYPVLQIGLARSLDADPTGRSLNCVQQAFAVWVATGDPTEAMMCFTQTSLFLLQVAPTLRPHLPALLKRFTRPNPTTPATNSPASGNPQLPPPPSAPGNPQLQPPPSVLAQPVWVATAQPVIPEPAPVQVIAPNRPLVTHTASQILDNSLRISLRGFRFEANPTPNGALPAAPPADRAVPKRPIDDQQIDRSDEDTAQLVIGDDDCEDSSRTEPKRRPALRLFTTRQARHSPKHVLRPSDQIQNRVAITSGQCNFRGCSRRIYITSASMCRLLYERTHWKCYMCDQHAHHHDDDSVRRCYNCAHDDQSQLIDVPVTSSNDPTFQFVYTLCDACLTYSHVKNQLYSSRECKRPDIQE